MSKINSISFTGMKVVSPAVKLVKNNSPLTPEQLKEIHNTLKHIGLTRCTKRTFWETLFKPKKHDLITSEGTRIIEERTPLLGKRIKEILFVGNTNQIDCVRIFNLKGKKTTVHVLDNAGKEVVAKYHYDPETGKLKRITHLGKNPFDETI